MLQKLILLGLALAIAGLAYAQKDFEKNLQKQLILAKDGATITIPAGNYTFQGSLSMESKKNVTIKGKGMEKTILSFKGQTEGAEGLRISNGSNITIQDLTIQDAKGDCIKTMNIDGITFKNVKVEWTGEPKETNGAYGFYPVSCNRVMMDGCVAIGSSDAGFYVGQSKNIIVKNSKAYHNVIGIEIENSLYADVHNNEAYDNAGGMMIIDLPDLVQKKGGFVRVYNNNLHNNNYRNFGPKGNIVSNVPSGTGLMIVACAHVEVFNNQLTNNKTANTLIGSYLATQIPIKDAGYYPYPTAINIHDNTYQRDKMMPTQENPLGLVLTQAFQDDAPDIVFDGFVDPNTLGADAKMKPEFQICVRNNKNARFVNLDAPGGFQKINTDATSHDCGREALKATKIEKKSSK
jgi:parallel beta-helix repeat protein